MSDFTATCPDCGAEMDKQVVPCPDGRAGRAVSHVKRVCIDCPKQPPGMYCLKCNERLATRNPWTADKEAVYCDNEECEHYGLLTMRAKIVAIEP